MIRIIATLSDTAPENTGAGPSGPSALFAPMAKSHPANGFAAPDLRTIAGEADGSGRDDVSIVRVNHLEIGGATAADGADANRPPEPALDKTMAPAWRARI